MISRRIQACILLYFSSYLIASAVLLRQSLHEYNDAVCSDGSAAAYYRENNKKDLKAHHKYVIYLRGGGYCHQPNECRTRCAMSPNMCTSWKASWKSQNGLLSSDPVLNPHFHDYFKVEIPYCSGDMFIGNRRSTVTTPNFKGRAIFDAVIQSLKRHTAIQNAADVLLAGGSAGGAGVVFNCNHLQQQLPGVKVHCIVDSAFLQPNLSFPIAEKIEGQCDDRLDEVLKTAGVFWNAPEIVQFSLYSWWERYTGPPLFIVSSLVDRFAFENLCGNYSSVGAIARWRLQSVKLVHLLFARRPDISFFVPTCFYHMTLTDDSIFNKLRVDNNTLSEALAKWLRGSTVHLAQLDDDVIDASIPCNSSI